jgi:pathogenesis-related protein 1
MVKPSAARDNIQEVAMDMLFRTLPFRPGLAVGALAGVMLIGSSGAVLADAPPGDFTTILNAHNAYRSQHCAAPLAWSDELAAAAQQWANTCTRDASGRFAHDNNAGQVGENLHWGTQTTAQGAVDSWYSEINSYNFDNPVYSDAVGHFTQVVWRGSTQLGCGVASCGNEKLWVCRYSPPGNWNVNQPGVLAANVQRACPGGDTSPPPQNPSGSTPGAAWSAFATNQTGSYGYATFYADEQTARQEAIKACNQGSQSGCEVFFTTQARCVSYAESWQANGWWYGAAGSSSEQEARQNAVNSCQSGGAPANTCQSRVGLCQ